MKKILFTTITISSLILGSCQSILDLKPKDFLSPEQYYNSEKELQTALTGVYSTFLTGGTYLNNLGRMGLDADEAFNFRELNSVANYGTSPSDTKILAFWREYYAGISRANKLLENIDKAEGVEDDVRAAITGEALFLRAYFYFMLASNFGDVPLVLESIETADLEVLRPKRTSSKVVYEQIINDLVTAADLVYDIDEIGHGGRVNKSAVYGLLARVNLYMAGNPLNDKSRYQEVVKWTKLIIDNPLHVLNESYEQVFVNYAQDKYDIGESIFEIEFWGNGIGIYATQGGFVGFHNGIQNSTDEEVGISYSYLLSTAYTYGVYEEGDLRRDWAIAPFYYTNTNPANEVNWGGDHLFNRSIGKFRRKSETLTPKHRQRTPQNYPIIRYADILLMYAEAENEINDGPTDAAYDAINKVRRRGFGLDQREPDSDVDLQGLSYEQFLTQIQFERTRELAFENMRKADLVRWGIFTRKMEEGLADSQVAPNFANLPRAQTYFSNASSRDVLWPIPSYEIGVNPNLTQNPGY